MHDYMTYFQPGTEFNLEAEILAQLELIGWVEKFAMKKSFYNSGLKRKCFEHAWS